MKINELEFILRQYDDDTEIVFLAWSGLLEYTLEHDGVRHHADSDTLAIDFLIK